MRADVEHCCSRVQSRACCTPGMGGWGWGGVAVRTLFNKKSALKVG